MPGATVREPHISFPLIGRTPLASSTSRAFLGKLARPQQFYNGLRAPNVRRYSKDAWPARHLIPNRRVPSPIASMGKQPREHFLHEDLAVFAPPLRVARVDRIFVEPDTVRAAEEEACHAFGHDDDAGSVV